MNLFHPPHLSNGFDSSASCAIFKSVFSPSECEAAADFIEEFVSDETRRNRTLPNHWSANIGENSSLKSVSLHDMSEAKLLEPFFEKLFEFYRPQLVTPLSFAEYVAKSPNEVSPTIFIYDCGFGKLERHRHQSDLQKSQFLLNLTKPGVDYSGGETEIEMPDGSIECFGSDFEQGDVFSFPYHLYHKVNSVDPAHGGRNKRISLLMPIFNSTRGKNLYGDK